MSAWRSTGAIRPWLSGIERTDFPAAGAAFRRIGASDSNIGFRDVTADAYYAQPAAWAAETGMTNGRPGGGFAPGAPCVRAQIAAFLWRADRGSGPP